MWCKNCVHMYVNATMIPIETMAQTMYAYMNK
jgi:hypothetical protein